MSYTTKENAAFNEQCTIKGKHWVKNMVKTALNYAYWAKDAAATWENHHIWKDSKKIILGTGSDVSIYWDGTNLLFVPAADDTLIEFADAASTQKSFDIKWYGDGSNGANYLYFDASANLIYTTGVDLQFKDNDYLVFGTGAGASGDVNIVWDGTNLIFNAVADDSLIEFGDAAATQKSFDLKWYGDDANGASYFGFDASANSLYTVGVDFLVDGYAYNKITTTTENTAGNETISASELLGGYYLRDCAGANRTDTTDTAANIVAAIDNAKVGTSRLFFVKNTSDAAETLTIAGGTGVTVSGTATVDQNNTKIFLMLLTNVTSGSEAVTLYSIGTLVH